MVWHYDLKVLFCTPSLHYGQKYQRCVYRELNNNSAVFLLYAQIQRVECSSNMDAFWEYLIYQRATYSKKLGLMFTIIDKNDFNHNRIRVQLLSPNGVFSNTTSNASANNGVLERLGERSVMLQCTAFLRPVLKWFLGGVSSMCRL